MFHLLNCGLFWAIAWTGCAMGSISARTTQTRGWRRGRVAISTPTLAAGIKDTTLTRHPCIIFYYRYSFFRSFKAQLHYKCMRSGDCFVSPAAAAGLPGRPAGWAPGLGPGRAVGGPEDWTVIGNVTVGG